jgi:hypothetical protein
MELFSCCNYRLTHMPLVFAAGWRHFSGVPVQSLGACGVLREWWSMLPLAPVLLLLLDLAPLLLMCS